jgi:SulP family sulfate permease
MVPVIVAALFGSSRHLVSGPTTATSVAGPDVTQLTTVGALPASLPPLSAPALTLDHIRALAPAALAVTLSALTEAVSIGRALGARGGYRIDGNQEFIGQGLSNIASAFFSGMWPRAPSTAAPSTMRPVSAHGWQRCLPGCY